MDDKTNIGLSDAAYDVCVRLKSDGVFRDLLDTYRLGIALAITRGSAADDFSRQRNMFNVGSLDPDHSLRDIIVEIYPDHAERPYAFAERLAEYGVAEIGRLYDVQQLRFTDLFSECGPPESDSDSDSS